MNGFFVFLALLLLGTFGGFLLWQDYLLFRRPRIRTTGIVVGHRTSEDDGSKYYSGRISFLDESGKAYEFTDSYGKATPKPEIGSDIQVIYPVGEPQHARIPRPFLRIVIYLFVFGTAVLLIGKETGILSI